MAHINRRYIDSHWLIFVFRGAISLLFGWIALFHSENSFQTIIFLTGIFLLSLSVTDFTNTIYRATKKTGWGVSVLAAIIDIIFALFLLFTINDSTTWHRIIIAFYTFSRGVFEILIGFRTTIDPTDRFIWVSSGICGTVMGSVILNSDTLSSTIFIRFFGAYLLIFGISGLIYGVHNRSQKLEDKIARSEAIKKRRK